MLHAIIQNNLNVEFVYNKNVHPVTKFSTFEIMYNFNPLTPLDLTPLPMDEQINLDGKKKDDFVKHIDEEARQNNERRTN